MAAPQTYVLKVATCSLDAQCQATLTTMLNNGWVKAHTLYTTTTQVLSPSELRYLLRHGGLALPSGPISTLNHVVAPTLGPRAGLDVGFELNVDLA
jgi:hypothetical protein